MVPQPQGPTPSSGSAVPRPFRKEGWREACASRQPLQEEGPEEGWEDTASTSIALAPCEGAREVRVTASPRTATPSRGWGTRGTTRPVSEKDFLPLFCLEPPPRCRTASTGAAFLLARCCPPSRRKGPSQREKSCANLGCVALCRLYWVNRENRVSK